MDYKNNARYFEKSKLSIYLIAAGVLAVIGIVLAIVEIPVGLAVCLVLAVAAVVIGFGSLPKDRDYDASAASNDRQFREDFHTKFMEAPMDRSTFLSAEFQNRKEPEYWSMFCMEEEGTQKKRGSDGAYRTSEYSMCGIWFEKERISVGHRTVNMLEERAKDEMAVYRFDDLALLKAEASAHEEAKYVLLTFANTDGSKRIMIPSGMDAHTDELVETINKLISRAVAAKE